MVRAGLLFRTRGLVALGLRSHFPSSSALSRPVRSPFLLPQASVVSSSSTMTQDLSKTLNPEGKDVVEIIIEEHRLVDALGDRFQTEQNEKEKQGQLHTLHTHEPPSSRLPPLRVRGSQSPPAPLLCPTGIAHNIIKLLSIHSVCEEAALYPWMRKNLPDGDKLVDHAIKEHQEIKEDLYALDQMTIDQPGYAAQLMKALKDTKHHVKEEESDLLPSIKQKSSPQELEQMRTDFLRAKMMAPSRPHPSAPTQPPANKIVGAATAPIDAVRDMGRFSS